MFYLTNTILLLLIGSQCFDTYQQLKDELAKSKFLFLLVMRVLFFELSFLIIFSCSIISAILVTRPNDIDRKSDIFTFILYGVIASLIGFTISSFTHLFMDLEKNTQESSD
jgi:hypothetical protein